MRMVISDLVGGIRQRFCLQLFYPVCPSFGIVIEAHFYGAHTLGKPAETNLLRDEASSAGIAILKGTVLKRGKGIG